LELFYLPDLSVGFAEPGENEVRHLRVLRKKPGDVVMCTDGLGTRAECVVADASPKKFLLEIKKVETITRPQPQLTLAVSPLKNPDRFEWLVEKCTESGVGTIVPIMCERTESSLKKSDRLQRIIQAATIQSLQYYMPELGQPMRFSEFLKLYAAKSKLIAWCDDVPKTPILSALHEGDDTIILIGPEGDFTKEEFDAAIAAKYQAISLGQNRLRTETAAVLAAQAFYLKNSK